MLRRPAERGSVADVLRRAQTLASLGRHQEAGALLSGALASDGGDYRLWCQLAFSQSCLHDKRAALESADHAVALAPDAEWGHRLRSVYLHSLGRYAEAAAAAEQAARLSPSNIRVLHPLAKAYCSLQEYAKAEACVEQMRRLAPEERLTHLAAFHVALSMQDYAAAEDACRSGLRLYPEASDLWNNLGLALRHQGRILDAIPCYREALRLSGDSDAARSNLRQAVASLRMKAPKSGALTSELVTWEKRETSGELKKQLQLLFRRLLSRFQR